MSSELLKQLSKPLNIKEVDFRVQSINNGGYATILAYKDARVDMNRLDEVCGSNWQKEYKYIESKNLLFCRVGIKIENEWIWREDLGTESFSDKDKGQASDAFKRACFNWGIGRELYNYPVIQVRLNADEFTVSEYQGKKSVKQTYNLKLKEWYWDSEYDDSGNIKKLIAKDEKGNIRFNYPNGSVSPPPATTANNSAPASNNQSPQPAASSQELNWLNVMDKDKNFTKQWLNVVEAINKKIITSVDDVRKHYKVSKETEAKINELLKY